MADGQFSMTTIIVTLAAIVDLGIKAAAVVLIPRNRRPSTAMAWLLAIFLIPYVGLLLFLLLGSAHLPKSRRAKQHEIDTLITNASNQLHLEPDQSKWPSWLPSVVELTTTVGALPVVSGNSAHLHRDYEEGIAAMAADILTARRFVHVEFYIIAFDETTSEFFAAMETAVKRGVKVRVLLDHIASIRSVGHRKTFAELDRIGVEWSFMLPVQPLKGKWQRPDLRNHRKLVVVDGRIGWVGSQNMIDRSYSKPGNLKRGLQWQELMSRVTGPVVTEINVIFLGDWYCETGEKIVHEDVAVEEILATPASGALDCQIVPSGPGFDNENNLRLFLALVYAAQKRVIITSPYFVPDEAMMYAITSSVQRGLDVQLFVSEIGDQLPVFHAQRSYYGELLRAGVTIWRYPAPYILHAKHVSIDDDVAVIGSSNMDIRSFALDLEVSMLVRGREFVDEMREVEAGYRAIGRQLTLDEWQKQPFTSTMVDGLARLTSALQ